MILELHPPMESYLVTDNLCSVMGNGDIQCCWPYSESCPPRFNDEVIGLAAGVMVTGGKKKLRNFVTKRGYYKVQTKSYGYGGGGYNLKIDISPGSGTPLPEDSISLNNGGPLSYGEVKFGNITYTGEQHEYTFNALKGDHVFVHMGPEWVPSPNDASSLCGKPYGKGKTCLDTMLTLISPSGKVERSNHVNHGDRNIVGSTLGTVRSS